MNFLKVRFTAGTLLVALLSIAEAHADLITNGSFETVSPALPANGICTSAPSVYPYGACSATGWTGQYQIGRGATVGIFGVSFGIPQPDPDGVNALILQEGVATATQSITIPTDGLYTLTFFEANRTSPAGDTGPQTLQVLFDGTLVNGGTLANIPGAWTPESLTFFASAGTGTLTFSGLGLGTSDVTAFIDDVSLNPATGTAPLGSTPEPSSLVLLGTGILGAAEMARRRLSHK
jgi:hypothetical protein